VDCVLAGLDAANQPFALCVGRHGPNYPYDDARSQWDHLVFFFQGEAGGTSAPRLDGLILGRADDAVRIDYVGTLGARKVELSLLLVAQPGDTYELGRPYRWMQVVPTPGLRWQPFHLTLDVARSSLRLDGQDVPLLRGFGEWEEGALITLRWREFAFRYDYQCLVDATSGALRLHVVTHALTTSDPVMVLLDKYARATASVDLVAEDGHFRQAQAAETLLQPSATLHVDRVSLGPADLERQLVQATGPGGARLFGLREVFHPVG
jgi:hypothetical protein